MRDDKIRVLFLSSPVFTGADTWVHYLVLKNLDPTKVERFAAGQVPLPGTPAPAFEELRSISGVNLRPTDFGPSFFQQTAREKRRNVVRMVPAVKSLLGLALYIRRHRIQIIHSTDRPRDAIACATLAALSGAKSVIHIHVKYDDWMGRGVRWAFGRADALIGVSNFVARSLIAGGYAPGRVHAVLNAIDPSGWDPALDPSPGRLSLGVEANAPLIVSVSRLFYWKGHTELIRAVALVKRDCPGVRLAIVGADYPPGSGVTEKLRATAVECGVADRVTFAGQRSDVPALLAACDVFALPSHEEPFGLVYAEAMAMKRPVVAIDKGGAPEVVRHRETGLLSPLGDIEALASNLVELLKDPSLRARMGEAGRQDVEARFTPARLARDVENVYSRVLDRPLSQY
jgi:glycosyltransferase involved in cell wall biosynthesis